VTDVPDPTAEVYERLKARVDETTRERDRSSGALEELKKRIKDEFGVSTERQARELQTKLDLEVERLSKEFQAAKEELEKKWGDKLDG
jgi:capsid protein